MSLTVSDQCYAPLCILADAVCAFINLSYIRPVVSCSDQNMPTTFSVGYKASLSYENVSVFRIKLAVYKMDNYSLSSDHQVVFKMLKQYCTFYCYII